MKDTLKNILYNGLYQLVIIILPLLTVPYVSRILGSRGMGINSLINSIPLLLTTIIIFGMNQLGVKVIAQSGSNDRRKNFVQLWLIQAIVGVLVILLFTVCSFFSHYAKYYLLEIPFLFGSLIDISWYYIGKGQIKKVILRNSLIKVLIVSSIFIFVRSANDLWIYLLINSITYLANFIFWVSLKSEFGRIFVREEVSFNRKYFLDAITVALPTIAAQLYVSFDQSLVGWLAGPRQLSFYALTQQMSRSFITLIGSVSTVLMPKMASISLQENGTQSVLVLLKKSLSYTSLVSTLIVSIIISNAKIFVVWFWGDSFAPMAVDMALGCLIVFFVSVGGVFSNQYTLSKGLYKSYALPYYIGAVFSLTLNLLLVPHFKSLGGTVTIVLTEFLVCVIRVIVLKDRLPVISLISQCRNYILAGIVTTVLVSLLPQLPGSLFLSLVFRSSCGVVLFMACLIVLKDDILVDINYILNGGDKK
ncbi:oligosaccharide flippase family protein [Lactiplantibacillus plantarum]|uniref:oligosaccharide flippase family protein n=1 Tax=Lactiplantibacillus plantarum TaxID=1590 RepID=UPI000398B4CF|nr:oligosaccharide flippase family protein [Lactiplantibacillus plantarum]ERJ48154.1 hypothetical protein N574_09120 [Lactiplantibacillus plantarum 2165]MCT3230077.1 teichoic acid transporter [Lactiplantibacillus plantarum]